MLRKLWMDQAGVIISAELVLVLTIAVLAMIVGLNEVAIAINEELNDISNAVGNLDQTYKYSGFRSTKKDGSTKSSFGGSSWFDMGDDCDKNESVLVCDHGGECENGYCGYGNGY